MDYCGTRAHRCPCEVGVFDFLGTCMCSCIRVYLRERERVYQAEILIDVDTRDKGHGFRYLLPSAFLSPFLAPLKNNLKYQCKYAAF